MTWNRRAQKGLFVSLSSIGWRRLAVVATFAIIGAYLAFAVAVSGVARTQNPKIALMFLPFESDALAAAADQLLLLNPEKPTAQVRQLAKESLRQKALNPRALRILGYYALRNGSPELADQFIQMAAKQSRREMGAQILLIASSARQENIANTLKHYDIVLSTKTGAQELLFPRLLLALEAQEVRSHLKPFMRSRRVWTREFLTFAIAENHDLSQIVDLISETAAISNEDNDIELRLLSKLVTEGKYKDARRLYLRFRKAKAAMLVSAGLKPELGIGGTDPMIWQLFDDHDAGGSFEQGNKNRSTMLSLYANPWTSRLIASKILYLSSGTYDFSAKLSKLERGDGGSLRWQLRCPSLGDSPVWKIENTTLSQRAKFTIPELCPTQFLEIVVSGGKGQTGLEASITSIAVDRSN